VYPDHPAVDEYSYVRAVADELGLSLDTYESTARPTDRLLDWVRLVDSPGPFLSLADVHQHRTLAAELGYRNVLSGEMAEGVFDESTHLLGHLVTHGRLGAAWRYLAEGRAVGESAYGQARRVLRMFVPMPLRRWRWERKGERLSPARERHRPRWLDPRELNPTQPVSARTGWRDRQLSPLIAATTAYEGDDVVHSLTGVSGRRPWADIDLWEFFLSLPAETKFPRRGRKQLMKELLRGRVPAVILDRRDKTVFNDAMLDRIDYPALESWLLRPDGYRMTGVDYELLAERLRSRNLDIWEFMWAKDLAAIHAFLSLY
jgi:asparagine synthetase B (glutamine-hydrolysing)